jgi:threonine/homoserine/homoserine lactone efflux protein
MKSYFKIFFVGILISFVASLAPGSINIIATHLAFHNSIFSAALFASGCIVIETVCLCIVLAAMSWIRKRTRLFRLLEYVTIIMIFLLAFSSFAAAYEMKSFGEGVLTGYHIHPFLLGIFVNTLNPMHIPFWLGWTTILMEKNVLIPGKMNYLLYVSGITIGTVAGFAGFIYGGKLIVQQFSNNQNIINWIVGMVLLLTALIHVYKLHTKYSLKTAKASITYNRKNISGNQ